MLFEDFVDVISGLGLGVVFGVEVESRDQLLGFLVVVLDRLVGVLVFDSLIVCWNGVGASGATSPPASSDKTRPEDTVGPELPGNLSSNGRIGPEDDDAVGSLCGESVSSFGFLSIGTVAGDVVAGVEGSCRFVACVGGVAGCLSTKSSIRTFRGVRDLLSSSCDVSA